MYRLVAGEGLEKGKSWALSEEPLVVGRERSCDVHVPDPVVSRRHCEFFLVGAEARLRDLGGVNTAQVNGVQVAECLLEVGDEIRVGRYVFHLERVPEDATESPVLSDGASTLSMAENECAFLSPRLSPSQDKDEQLAPDFEQLFHLGRMLTRCSSRHEFCMSLGEALTRRFRPQDAWLVLTGIGDPEATTIRRLLPSGGTSPLEEGGMKLVKKTLELRQGRLAVDRSTGAAAVLLTAPLLLGRHEMGALLVCGSPAEPLYGKPELDFLVALAHTAAPILQAIERVRDLEAENRRLRAAKRDLDRFIGDSPVMRKLLDLVRLIAPTGRPVLIQGETGTGKELVASLIHQLSKRSEGLLVSLNCAAIPHELFESEFFGYEKGAFTSAAHRKLGLIEQSHDGTLFLDEIADLALEHQARILRAIETMKFRRVGGTEEIAVDFRLVVASNKLLDKQVQQTLFRADLYHRCAGVTLSVPPLRERREDIPLLAEYFLAEACLQAGRQECRLTPKATEYLRKRDWPGNVRELKNCIETALALCQTDQMEEETLHVFCSSSLVAEVPLPLADLERNHIVRALDYFDGRVIDAAKCLGVSKSTLYNKIAQYGLRES